MGTFLIQIKYLINSSVGKALKSSFSESEGAIRLIDIADN